MAMEDAAIPAATLTPSATRKWPRSTAPQIKPSTRNGRLSDASQSRKAHAARSFPSTMEDGVSGVLSSAGSVRCSRSCVMEPALESGPMMTSRPRSENALKAKMVRPVCAGSPDPPLVPARS